MFFYFSYSNPISFFLFQFSESLISFFIFILFYCMLLSKLLQIVLFSAAATAAKSLQSCLTLCDPIDCSPPGSSVPGILQARILEWVAISFSKRNYKKKGSEVAQSCLTLCDPMDCSLPGSSVPGILQARVLEWVAIYFLLGTNIKVYS